MTTIKVRAILIVGTLFIGDGSSPRQFLEPLVCAVWPSEGGSTTMDDARGHRDSEGGARVSKRLHCGARRIVSTIWFSLGGLDSARESACIRCGTLTRASCCPRACRCPPWANVSDIPTCTPRQVFIATRYRRTTWRPPKRGNRTFSRRRMRPAPSRLPKKKRMVAYGCTGHFPSWLRWPATHW